jgi:hypothetical protein
MPIKINIEKAKKIHLNRWREARRHLLEKLDLEYMRYKEQHAFLVKGSDLEKELLLIVDKKQALRDVTDVNLNSVKTLDQLSQAWPECLGQKPDYTK